MPDSFGKVKMIFMADHQPESPTPRSVISALSRQEKIAIIVFFVLALIYAGWQIYQKNQTSVHLGEDIEISAVGIVVQVEGAVVSPGLVSVPHGARVSDAIEAAGGFLTLADRDALNLAKLVEDGDRIDVPYSSEPGRSVPRDDDDGVNIRRVPYPVPGSGEEEPEEDGLVNINTASPAELDTLPQIGPELASRIIEYRINNGPFMTIENIMDVDGIGEGRFEAIRELITVGD